AANDERGRREVVLGGDGLQGVVVQPAFEGHHRGGISGEDLARERVDRVKGDLHGSILPQLKATSCERSRAARSRWRSGVTSAERAGGSARFSLNSRATSCERSRVAARLRDGAEPCGSTSLALGRHLGGASG